LDGCHVYSRCRGPDVAQIVRFTPVTCRVVLPPYTCDPLFFQDLLDGSHVYSGVGGPGLVLFVRILAFTVFWFVLVM